MRAPLLVTFDPHPARILHPHGGPPLITPMARKLELLSETELDAVVVVPFTRDLSMMPAFEFAEEILFNKLHAIEVHEGFNFRFGHKAEGDVERLREFGHKLGFTVVTHTPMRWGELVVSSSNVRAAVLGGKVEMARHLLGRPFSIDSTPGRGRGYGAKYTVPTVNLARYDELTPAIWRVRDGDAHQRRRLPVGHECRQPSDLWRGLVCDRKLHPEFPSHRSIERYAGPAELSASATGGEEVSERGGVEGTDWQGCGEGAEIFPAAGRATKPQGCVIFASKAELIP